MTRLRILSAALICGIGVLAACSGGSGAVDQNAGGQFRYHSANAEGSVIPADQRKLAGAVSGTLLSGGTYQLSQDRGKVVLLNFFASWCPPCQVESPQLDSLYREHRAAGFNLVGIDVKDPNRSQLDTFVQNKGLTYPVVVDEAAKTAIQLGDVPINGLPASILIDKAGRVAAIYPKEVFNKDLEPVLAKLLAGY